MVVFKAPSAALALVGAVVLCATAVDAQWGGCDERFGQDAYDWCVYQQNVEIRARNAKIRQEIEHYEHGTDEERAMLERKWNREAALQQENAQKAADWSRRNQPTIYYSETCRLKLEDEGLDTRLSGDALADWVWQCIQDHIAADRAQEAAARAQEQKKAPLTEKQASVLRGLQDDARRAGY